MMCSPTIVSIFRSVLSTIPNTTTDAFFQNTANVDDVTHATYNSVHSVDAAQDCASVPQPYSFFIKLLSDRLKCINEELSITLFYPLFVTSSCNTVCPTDHVEIFSDGAEGFIIDVLTQHSKQVS